MSYQNMSDRDHAAYREWLREIDAIIYEALGFSVTSEPEE